MNEINRLPLSDCGDGEAVATMCGMGVGDHPWAREPSARLSASPPPRHGGGGQKPWPVPPLWDRRASRLARCLVGRIRPPPSGRCGLNPVGPSRPLSARNNAPSSSRHNPPRPRTGSGAGFGQRPSSHFEKSLAWQPLRPWLYLYTSSTRCSLRLGF